MWYSIGDCRASTRHRAVMYRSRSAAAHDIPQAPTARTRQTPRGPPSSGRPELLDGPHYGKVHSLGLLRSKRMQRENRHCRLVGGKPIRQKRIETLSALSFIGTEAQTKDIISDWAVESLMVRSDHEVQHKGCLKQEESHVSKDLKMS